MSRPRPYEGLTKGENDTLVRALSTNGRLHYPHRITVNHLTSLGWVEWRNNGWQLTEPGWTEARRRAQGGELMQDIELTVTEAETLELAAEQGGHVINFSKNRHDGLVIKKLVGWNAAAQAWWLTDRGRAEARKRGWLV